MSIRRHKTIEIYFILYLAAIIFLLPDKNADIDSRSKEVKYVAGDFSIQPLKTSLTCRFYLDSSGVHIVSIDSMNTIFLVEQVKNSINKFKDINFKFEVEDLTARQKQIIKGKSGLFRFEENLNNKELKFIWKPKLSRNLNKTYVVRVIATIKNNSVSTETNATEIYKSETQFSLVLADVTSELEEYGFDNERYIQDNPIFAVNNVINNQERIYVPVQGDIIIDPVVPEVEAIAYKNWSNRINIFGANPSQDLSGNPNLIIYLEPKDNNGSAKLEEIGKNYIILSGKTPSHGRMKVVTEMKFKSDNKKRSVDFYVSPKPIGRPSFSSIMYPEKWYQIKTNLPMLSGQATEAVIKDKKDILLRSEQGEVINFKPEISHIGKTLVLERLIDNILYDKYDIRIQDYPEPVIINIQKDNEDQVKVQTRSFGYNNGEKNFVRLVIEGNATERELRGQLSEEDIAIIQVFRITPKDKDQAFKFEIKAVDSRGRSSAVKKFSWYD